MQNRCDIRKSIYIGGGIPALSVGSSVNVSELPYRYSVGLDLGRLMNGQEIISVRYGEKGEKIGFHIKSGSKRGKINNSVYCAYVPTSIKEKFMGGLLLISRKAGSYLVIEMLEYDRIEGQLMFLSPAGASEKQFRDDLPRPEEIKDDLNVDSEGMPERYESALMNCLDDVSRAIKIHDMIGHEYKGRLKAIPEAAWHLYNLAGIPCLIIKGFCIKSGSPVRIEQGEKMMPNCEWNMIYVNGEWRFLDIARDINIGHGDNPAVNDFLSSPEWFGMNHISIEAVVPRDHEKMII